MNKTNRNKNLIVFLMMIVFFVMFSVNVYSVNVNVCQELNISGTTYDLINAIDNAPGTCMVIDNHSITFVCAPGRYIDGNNAGYGIQINGAYENVSIQNCEIKQFLNNIYSKNNINLSLENISSHNAADSGFYFDSLDGGNFTNIFINDSDDDGIYNDLQTKSFVYYTNLTIVDTNGNFNSAFWHYRAVAGSVLKLTGFNLTDGGFYGFRTVTTGSDRHVYLTDGLITDFSANNAYGVNADARIYADNLSITNIDFGFAVASASSGGYVKNCSFRFTQNAGLYFGTGINDYNITNNTILNNSVWDVRIDDVNSQTNIFWNNIFRNASNMTDSGSNKWNISTGGNRWILFDEPSEGCFDTNNDGICDNANVTIDADSIDYLPLYNGDPFKCGYNVTTDLILAAGMDCNETALYLVSDNIKLDCANNIIRGDGAGVVGLKINSTNVTITGCKIYNFTTNVYADPGVGLKIENNTFVNSSNCTILEAYNSSVIRNNTYHNCTDNAILLINESWHNRIYNNSFNLSWIGVNIRNGTNNTVWNNSFTNSLHAHANAIIGNNFNSSVGNYWDDILSLKIFDTDSDGLGDAGSEYPYNNTNNANVTGLVNDYRPFTTKSPGKFVVNITAPLNNSISNTSNVNITCEVNSSDNVNNLTFIIWDVLGNVHQTNSTNPAQSNITLTWEATLSDGNYTAGCNATNVLNQRNLSDNRTFRVDATRPLVQLISPADGTSTTTTNNTFVFEANDSTLMNCSLNIDSNSVANFTNIQNGTYNSSELLAVGVYNWNVTCVDEAGWTNTSETWTITITGPAPPGGGPTQGGGNQYIVIDDELVLEQERIKAAYEEPKILDLLKQELEKEEIEEELEEKIEKIRVIKEIPRKTIKFSLKAFFLALFALTLVAVFLLRKRTNKTEKEIKKFKKAFGVK